MAASTAIGSTPVWRLLRMVIWGGAGLLLLFPLIAMQFTPEVQWTPSDFAVMGVLLGLVCGAFEVALRAARSHLYMVAAGVAAATAFLMTWVNLAVGIVGNENNSANLIFFGVVAIAMIGAALARLESLGMARAMAATASAQVATSAIAFASGEGRGAMLIGVFVAMWLMSAELFRKASQQEARACGAR